MLGVDKSYQLIAYYRPIVRCRRYWMALMFHCLDIMRINSFIICNKAEGGLDRIHKTYLECWIEALLGRASAIQYGRTRAARVFAIDKSPIDKKTFRMSLKHPSLQKERLQGNREDHIVSYSGDKSQRICRYCSYLRAVCRNRGNNDDSVHVRYVQRICLGCSNGDDIVHLCNDHFDIYIIIE